MAKGRGWRIKGNAGGVIRLEASCAALLVVSVKIPRLPSWYIVTHQLLRKLSDSVVGLFVACLRH